ncbi:MAG: glycosyltransferase family 4 protein [Planctomycetota bacterium]
MPSRPLTVLQVLPGLDAGGVERGTLEVGAELVRRGHRSLVVSEGGRLVESLERDGSEHFTATIGRKSPLTLKWVRWLRRLLVEQNVDVVHARSRVPAWVTWFAWKKLPVETRPHFVTTVHGMYSVSRYSEIMTRGEAVIAVSETIRDYICRNYPSTPEDRIRLIFRGVDPQEFPHGYTPTAQWRREFFEQFPECIDRTLLTLPGRITRLKGHHAFLDTIAQLVAKGYPVHGLIVGAEDPRRQQYAAEVKQTVCDLGLSDRVTLTGHRSDIRDIYTVSDLIFSLSSKPESFGRTVLEPLSLGTPVVGFAHGGVGEILDAIFPQGGVPVGATDELVAATERLLTERPKVAPVMQFRLSDMLDATLNLYQELCADEDSIRAAA